MASYAVPVTAKGQRLDHFVVQSLQTQAHSRSQIQRLILAGAVLVTIDGRHRLGWTLAYFGMLVLVTLADLIGFYLRQFDSLLIVFLHVVLLLAVIASRDELRAEPALAPSAEPGRMS